MAAPMSSDLTPREREVLNLIAEGESYKGVGNALVITQKTVESHLAVIRHKLGARNSAHAVALAARAGVLP